MVSTSDTLDLTPIIQPILEVIGLVMAGLIVGLAQRAISAFERRTGIHLTDQQRATMIGAVQTAAGNVETKIDQGLLHVAQIRISDPAVLAEARAAIAAVPDAAAQLGMTEAGVARMIVGKVDTAPRVVELVATPSP